jgi:phosphatidylglycerol lysyltransferase
MMRHRQAAAHGHMDFLFISLLEWAKQNGYATFNLGLSALSGIGERPGDPALERSLHYVYEHVDQFYNFKGLHAFKEKYHPTWSPRYLVYPGAVSLPAVAVALIRADQGGGLLAGYF